MGVQDYTDGKQVVHTLERTLLLLHLLVDGVDGLGAPLDVEMQSRLFQLLLYRSDKSGYILVARCFGFIQFLLDVVVDFLLRVLQRKVFQFRLQFVQTQLMGEGSVQIGGFIGHLPACFVVLALLYLAHDVHAVGNHDEDNAHVLCKGQQQVAEVLRLDGGAFGVKFVYPYQSAYDARHILAVVPFHFFGGTGAAAHGVVEHQSLDARLMPISSATITAVCISFIIGFSPKISRCMRLFCIEFTRCVFSFLQSPLRSVSPESCNNFR